MSLLKKMKTVKKRWYLLLIIVVVIGGSAAARFNHARYETLASTKLGPQVIRQVNLDLVFLETVDTTKVTPAQAKEILPLMEKLSLATDLTVQSDLAKQVYGMLTPMQYSILTDSQNQTIKSSNPADQGNHRGQNNESRKETREAKGHDFDERGSSYGKGSLDPKEQALSSVVIKMLNDRSTEQIQPKA